jgi:antitoxin MazE
MYRQEVLMRAVVKKWGNSASVRIPASVMAAAGLRLDQAVDVREDNGRIVIEPMQREDHDLADLLAGITPENIHDEVDFGAPVGNEAL